MPTIYSDWSAEASAATDSGVLAPTLLYHIGSAAPDLRERPWPPVGGVLGAETAQVTRPATGTTAFGRSPGELWWTIQTTSAPLYRMPVATRTVALARTLPNSVQLCDIDAGAGKVLYRTQAGPAVYVGNIDGTGIDVLIRSGSNYHGGAFDPAAGLIYVLGPAGGSNWTLWSYNYAGALQTTHWTISEADLTNLGNIKVDPAAGYLFAAGYAHVFRIALADGSRIALASTGSQNGTHMLDIDPATQQVVYGRASSTLYVTDYALGSWASLGNMGTLQRSVALVAP